MNVRARPPRDLDDFVAWYHAQSEPRSAFDRIEQVYASILPGDFGDADLRTFLEVLYAATVFWKPHNVVQTGTFVGSSSIAIALGLEHNQRGELFTIDPEPPVYFHIERPVDIARRAVAAAGVGDRVHFVRGYSTIPLDVARMELPAGPNWRLTNLACSGDFDLVVIDGDHTTTGCLMDLVFGSEGLAPRGPRVIVVHDYLGIPEVRAAVRRWTGTFPEGALALKVVPSRCGIALIQLAPGARSGAHFDEGNLAMVGQSGER